MEELLPFGIYDDGMPDDTVTFSDHGGFDMDSMHDIITRGNYEKF